jgi:hypothetical protein
MDLENAIRVRVSFESLLVSHDSHSPNGLAPYAACSASSASRWASEWPAQIATSKS